MDIVFMGTPDFAVPALNALIDSKHKVKAVITQPDKPKGRGEKVIFSPVKEEALKNNIEVYQPNKIRDIQFVQILKDINPDIIVVAAFGQIISKEILEMPKYGCINIHGSILPKYRGAAPIQWSIIDGEDKTGITIMQMNEGIDTGDIIDILEVPIEKDETGGSLFDKLSVLGGKFLIDVLEKIENNSVNHTKQIDSESSYAKMLNKELGNLDFNQSAITLERLIRGLNPWPSAYTYINNKMLKIWKAEVVSNHLNEKPGTVVKITKNSFFVSTGDGLLEIKELQLAGKKRMSSSTFLLGYKLETGMVLGK